MKEFFEGNKDLFKTEGGLPSKFMAKMRGYGKTDGTDGALFESSSDITKSSTNETFQKPNNISTDTQNSHSNGEVKQESQH